MAHKWRATRTRAPTYPVLMSTRRAAQGSTLFTAALAAACTGESHGSVLATATAGDTSDPTAGDTGAPEEVCTFPDPRLEAEVRILAGLPEGPLHPSALYQIGVLSRHESGLPFAEQWMFFGIRDLSGIECIPELRGLSCHMCPIEDLAPLAAVEGLTRIRITGARVNDLDALAGTSTLESISMRDGLLEDIDALFAGGVDLPLLVDADFAGNQLGDDLIAPELPALQSLDLSGNDLTRTPAMGGVPELELLRLSDNPLTDIETLSELASLRELEVARAQITSLDALIGLPLERLDLADNQVVDPSPIALMPRLLDVDLARNAIVGLAGVESATLQHLRLAENPLQSVAGLAVTGLVELDISGGAVTSFDGLVAFAGVEPGGPDLVAEHNQIVDLSGLAVAPNLSRLALSHNPVDLTTLPAGMEIQRLELDSTGITSLDPLAQILWGSLSAVDNALTALPPLQGSQLDSIRFDLSGNLISDLSPLAGFWFYYTPTLILADNAISDLSPLADVRFIEKVELNLADNAITDLNPLATTIFDEGGHIDLSGNPIASLAPLAAAGPWPNVGLSRLTAPVDLASLAGAEFDALDLSDNGLVDVAALVEAKPSLLALDLSRNELTAAPSFAALPLRDLHLDGNPLASLGALPASLWVFTCAGCSFTSLEGVFAEIESIDELDLSDTPLTSLAGLVDHIDGSSRLRLDRLAGVDFAPVAARHPWISARGCGLDDVTPFVGRGADLRENPITDIAPIAALSNGASFIIDGAALDLDRDDFVLDLYAICAADLATIEIGAIRCELPSYCE